MAEQEERPEVPQEVAPDVAAAGDIEGVDADSGVYDQDLLPYDDAPEPEPEGEGEDGEAAPSDDAEPVVAETATPPATADEHEPEPAPVEAVEAVAPAPTAYQRLWRALRPAYSRSQLLAGVLCALLGFALVAQVRHSGQDELAGLRQDDLVRLLDDVTGRAEALDSEVSRLQSSRDELESGSDNAKAALELAQQRATSEGILSGRLPAQGPGVKVVVHDPGRQVRARDMFNMLEELRNAGAEVVQLNGVRLVTSSSFVDSGTGLTVDGHQLDAPYEWLVIGDPPTIDRALEIPGGALPTLRSRGATTDETQQLDKVTIDAVVHLEDPKYARPADPGNG